MYIHSRVIKTPNMNLKFACQIYRRFSNENIYKKKKKEEREMGCLVSYHLAIHGFVEGNVLKWVRSPTEDLKLNPTRFPGPARAAATEEGAV